jgi:hypothetical protein
MEPQNTPSVASFIPTSLFLFLLGWGGLIALLLYTIPNMGPRWMFFFLTVVALTGTFMPMVAFLNRRFPGKPPATSLIVVRQSLWIGIYGATLAWLQIGHVLTNALAFLLALGLILIEFLLRLSERSQWKP